MKEKILRRLLIKSFHIKDVSFGEKTKLEEGKLLIKKQSLEEYINASELIVNVNINIIKPNQHSIETNTIMDIIPISTKVLGQLGEGITHTLTGVYVVLTGADEDKNQMHEFGSSEGILSNQICYGMSGTPKESDYIIHVDITLKGGIPYERKVPLEAFKYCDMFIQEIREELKEADARKATEVNEFFDKVREGAKKVVIVKQIAGQGAMYDNQLFSNEPSGLLGGVSIIDIKNVPMIISPNEYRDGALRSMT
ncbi:proline reductase cluster protein PrdD [Romboutsia sp.]|uniref:proline reductase cluster protein PrdD n=1 Tax=Romboutsia sp. TaxID=1965302 RepID=UPI003F2F644B